MWDASGRVHVNIYTNFSSSAGDSESVRDELKETLSCVNACTNCILKGEAKNCSYLSTKELALSARTQMQSNVSVQCVFMFPRIKHLHNDVLTRNWTKKEQQILVTQVIGFMALNFFTFVRTVSLLSVTTD